MRTGDAEVEVWREGLRHTYCLEIRSHRRGVNAKPVYRWEVEQWTRESGDETTMERCKSGVEHGFQEALRQASRAADAMERAEVEKRRRA